MNEKQCTTNVVDIETTPREEIYRLIPNWSEGNSELEKLLKNMIDDGIPTIGCCSGHNTENDNGGYPQIAFKIYKESRNNQIIDFLAKLEVISGEVGIFLGKGENYIACTVLKPKKERDNGEFFEAINSLYTSKSNVKPEIRTKYEAFITLMLDDRTSEGYKRIYYLPGDTNVEVLGFKGCNEHKSAKVKCDTVVDKAEYLKGNPDGIVNEIFGKNEMIPIIYSIEWIKDLCERTKQTLGKIRESWRKIKEKYTKGKEIPGEVHREYE